MIAPAQRRVFVSSTFKDLRRHREAARDACLQLIRERSDVFVGIYAYRYGTIPPGDALSITEQEFDEARKRKLPLFLYEVNRHHRWNEALKEGGGAAEALAAFKERLILDASPWPFTTPKDLAVSIAGDLGRYFADPRGAPVVERGLIHAPPSTWVSQARATRWQYKVAAFDLDGTLFRGPGFVFSWELIWGDLGFGPGVQADLKRAYLQHVEEHPEKSERIRAYEVWCDEAVERFQARGLTRERLRTLAQERVTLTQNARATLRRLRAAGIATALISGGVDTFLKDAFPDYREYFDFVYINELTFDDAGVIDGVRATAFDFEGKVEALKQVCQRVGCTLDEAVFVGDQINDRRVLLRAGLGIAYPSTERVAGDAATVRIPEDDLERILPHVLVE